MKSPLIAAMFSLFDKRVKSLAFITLVFLAPHLHADSVLLETESEMIVSADYVAVVEFQKAERGVFKGSASYPKQKESETKQFSRRVTVRVISNLKGKLPEEIQVYDRSGHWDALFQNHLDQSKSDSGRFLIFLVGDVHFLTGANGWASTSRIANEQIERTEKSNSPKFQMVKLDEVLERVRKQIEVEQASGGNGG